MALWKQISSSFKNLVGEPPQQHFSCIALTLGTCAVVRGWLRGTVHKKEIRTTTSSRPRTIHSLRDTVETSQSAKRSHILALAAPSQPVMYLMVTIREHTKSITCVFALQAVHLSARVVDSLQAYLKDLEEDTDQVYVYLFHTRAKQIPSNAMLATPVGTESLPQLTGAPLLVSTLQLYDELFTLALDMGKPALQVSIFTDDPCGYTMSKGVTKTICEKAECIYLERWSLMCMQTGSELAPAFFSSQTLSSKLSPLQLVTHGERLIYLDEMTNSPLRYEKVAVGGTFDQFHAGHKKLLVAAASVTGVHGKLLIGITSPTLLKKKQNKEKIQSFKQRQESVVEFLSEIAPEISVDIQELEEPMGDAATDPTMKAIVVSSETIKGAQAINEYRKKWEMEQLDIVAISRRLSAVESSSYLRTLQK